MRYGFPLAISGQTIGLFGGTFDPPHEGHVLAATRALRRLHLDQIWWLPSPGNPLKSRQPTPIKMRMKQIQDMISHPKMKVTDIETQLGTIYTYDTVRALQEQYVGVRFVLIVGSDILNELHHWGHWVDLAKRLPICVIARTGEQIRAGLSPFAKRFEHARLEPQSARLLPFVDAAAWVMLPGIMSEMSSSKLGAENGLD